VLSETSDKENDPSLSQVEKQAEPKCNLIILERESDLPRFGRDAFAKAWRSLSGETNESEDELKTGTD
jgi:hypothetical protein